MGLKKVRKYNLNLGLKVVMNDFENELKIKQKQINLKLKKTNNQNKKTLTTDLK